jgi:hypothetical protein
VYRFSTTTAGRVDVAISSASFEGGLVLLDAKDNTLALGGSRVIADLAAGTYSLVALSDAPGNYSVNYTFTPQNLSGCPEPPKVPVNVRFRAVLGVGPCRGADGQPLDSYEFTNASPGLAAIFMTSAAVNGYLTLSDSQGTVLRRDDNSFGFGAPMMVQWLPAGTYRFNASGSGGLQTGQYQVDLLFVSGDRPAGCLPVGDLNTGVTQATLNVSGCQYVDDTFGDIYRLTLPAATKLDITMASANFDSYLILLDEKGNVIDIDDDSGGGASAKLTSSIEPGTYYVVAKSFVDNGYAVGGYTLTVR